MTRRRSARRLRLARDWPSPRRAPPPALFARARGRASGEASTAHSPPRPRARRGPPRSRPGATRPYVRALRAGREQRRLAAAAGVHLDDGACCAYGVVEARVGRVTAGACGIAVQQHDDGVARSVLELLDHQLSTPRRRRPVHAPQRLALGVLADGVEVEPGRSPQEQPAAGAAEPPRVAEEPLQLDESRMHRDRRARRVDGERDRVEPEVVPDHELGVRDPEDASG